MKKQKELNSAVIKKMEYDTDSAQLIITFTHGAVYKYFGVPAYEYHELINAESTGVYYNQTFRKQDYEFIRIK